MSNFKYMSEQFGLSDTNHIARGHNKKFIIKIDNETYFFKYDAEKEVKGNMQKRFASAFCSFLANKYGGNLVEDIPGEAIVEPVPKEHSTIKLKGVYSKSYKEDYHICQTFTLDEVLKPREDESFEYNNQSRVFASVENSMTRLKSYIESKIEEENTKAPYSIYCNLNDLESDYAKIQDDLVSIVLLDYLFLNNDRHTENIEFSIKFDDNNNYHLVVSPVFDNDRTFGLDKDESKIVLDCANKFNRNVYVDYCADVKFTLRNIDCDNEFAYKMDFANNYHAHVLAEYIKQQCSNEQGILDINSLKNNQVYKLYQSYKDINIKKEFFEFLSEVADIDNVYSLDITKEQEENFLEEFNKKTDSTLSINHIMELTQNFTIRQNLLNEAMSQKLPEVDTITEDFVQ